VLTIEKVPVIPLKKGEEQDERDQGRRILVTTDGCVCLTRKINKVSFGPLQLSTQKVMDF